MLARSCIRFSHRRCGPAATDIPDVRQGELREEETDGLNEIFGERREGDFRHDPLDYERAQRQASSNFLGATSCA